MSLKAFQDQLKQEERASIKTLAVCDDLYRELPIAHSKEQKIHAESQLWGIQYALTLSVKISEASELEKKLTDAYQEIKRLLLSDSGKEKEYGVGFWAERIARHKGRLCGLNIAIRALKESRQQDLPLLGGHRD